VAELEKRLSGLSASGTRRGYRGIRKRASWGIGDLPRYEIAIGPDFERGEMRGHARGVIAIGDIATDSSRWAASPAASWPWEALPSGS
jgi:hypothetical protein